MLGSVSSDEIFHIMTAQRPADLARMRAGFAELPASWEAMRPPPADAPRNRAERRAARRHSSH